VYAVESGSELILDNLAGCDSESPLPLLLRAPRRPCIDRSSRIQQLVRGVRSDLYIGDDTWPPPASVAADSNAISARDLNGDGKLDFVLSDRSVPLGNGDRTFQAAQSYNATRSAAISEVLADLTGDGKPDLVVADSFHVTALLNIPPAFSKPPPPR
jgi:hypothetical protein